MSEAEKFCNVLRLFASSCVDDISLRRRRSLMQFEPQPPPGRSSRGRPPPRVATDTYPGLVYENVLEDKIFEMQRELERLEARNALLEADRVPDKRLGRSPERNPRIAEPARLHDRRALDYDLRPHENRPHTSPERLAMTDRARPISRDVATPAWSTISFRSTCSVRIAELSTPRSVASKFRKDLLPFGPLPPISAWGRPHRIELGEASRLGELTTPRSVDPANWERPVVISEPRLSAHCTQPHGGRPQIPGNAQHSTAQHKQQPLAQMRSRP